MSKLRIPIFFTFGFLIFCSFVPETVLSGEKNPFQAKPSITESIINGVNIRYNRDDDGCSLRCQFWNDPERCGDNSKCRSYAKDEKAQFIGGLPTEVVPKIEGETVKSAGNTTGPAQMCDEFIITTHGSPGWVWNKIGGQWYLVCLGYYYAPLQLCCDPSGCVKKP